MPYISKFLGAVSRVAILLAAGGLVVMTAIVGWQIFARYVLNDTPNWSERLSIFLMNWYILLAAAAGVREKFHLGLVIFRNAATGWLRILIDSSVYLAVGGFGLAMILYGGRLAKATWTHTIPTLGISNGWSYMPLPVAGVLIILFSMEHLAQLLRPAMQRDPA